MLSVELNETISHVGPGTVMGNFMREYWLPALLSSELPNPDCDPVRVRMLGENLIGFRDTSGKVGLIENLCTHRGASLFFGRNEEGGIRCVYHGWKFDTSGNCIDMPNEPPESNFKSRIKARAYPCEERGSAVFVYMGTREVPPPLPHIEAWMTEGGATASARQTECNWLQVMEGNIDTIHAVFLHGGHREAQWFPEGSYDYYAHKQRWARFESADTESGAIYGAIRPGPEGYEYWRIGKFMFPCWSTAAQAVMGRGVGDTCWVPMDDDHTMVYGFSPVKRDGQQAVGNAARRTTAQEQPEEPQYLPNTTDWYGRFRPRYNMENDFLMDRDRQRSLWSFTGMPYGPSCEDPAVQISMGPILPREIEHLGTSDGMVIRVRQRLLDAAVAFAEHKTPPPALDTPEVYLGRVGQLFIPEGADWLEYTEDLRKPFVSHPPLDASLLSGPVNSPNKTQHVPHKRSPMF